MRNMSVGHGESHKQKSPIFDGAFSLDSLFRLCPANADGKGLCASWATHGMLALLSGQSQRRFTFWAIAKHVRVGILIAAMSAEQAAYLVFKCAPFAVFGLSFIDLARKGTRS
jgi:hypothetical protein